MRRRIIASVTSWCLLLLTLGGPLFAAQMGTAQPAPVGPPFKIVPGTELQIKVDPQVQYNTTLVVLPDGRIYLPIIGEMVAAGLTVQELHDAIVKGFSKELRNFSVVVIPTHIPPGAGGHVSMAGEVRSPGVLNVGDNTT